MDKIISVRIVRDKGPWQPPQTNGLAQFLKKLPVKSISRKKGKKFNTV